MEYLNTPLKDGTTYAEYLEESVQYRNNIIEGFVQEILFSPKDEDDLIRFAKHITTELLPDKDLFLNEEDYSLIFQETLTELIPH